MDRWATKDHYERETEEAERLVRQAPKAKPPRHDRRREETETDRDPDIDTDEDIKRDPDLSLNRKNVGGSVRILSRFLGRDPLALAIARRVRADLSREGDWVEVINKETGEGTRVKEETLKGPEGAKYKVVKKEETKKKTPEEGEAEEEGGEGGEAKGDEAKPSGETGEQLRQLAESNPQVKGMMEILGNPKHPEYTTLTSIPAVPLSAMLKGVKLPEGIATVGDLQKAVAQGKKEKPKKEKAEKGKPGGETAQAPFDSKEMGKQIADAVAAALGEALKQYFPKGPPSAGGEPAGAEKPKEEPKAETKPEPPPKKEEKPPEEEAEPEPEEEAEPEKPKEKAPKGPPRRKVTKEEEDAALRAIIETFPEGMAEDLLTLDLHPDDVSQLVNDYHMASKKKVPLKDLSSFAASAARFHQTDPNKVPPPKVAKDSSGVEKPFEELSPEEQTEAWQQHRMRTVALSLAAQEHLSNTLQRQDTPPRLARQLASHMLRTQSGETDQARMERADKEAQDAFADGIAEGAPEKISDGTIKNVLEGVKDPAAKKLAIAYFQARDYQMARDKFLDPKSDDHISEFQTPDQIISGLKKAEAFLKSRSKLYSKDSPALDTAKTFRNRVLGPLRTLAPTTYPVIQAAFDKQDNAEYDADLKKFTKDTWKHQRQVRDIEKQYEKDYAKYKERLGKGEGEWMHPEPPEPPRPLTADERLLRDGVEEPDVEDQKAYAKYLKKRQKAEGEAKRDREKYEGAYAKWDAERQKAREENESEEESPDEEDTSGDPYRTAPKPKKQPAKSKIEPPKTVAELLQDKGIVEPREPVKPPRYDAMRATEKDEAEGKSADMWEEQFRKVGANPQAARIAAKYLSRAKYSSYPRGWTMADSSLDPARAAVRASLKRQGVYWGAEPYPMGSEGFAPYVGWQQAHARDLGEKDYNSILTAAREWLKVPVLGRKIEGLYPDTQFRAALDLAIRDHEDGRYSVGLHPTVYNDLLSKLSGGKGPYELLSGKPDTVPMVGVRQAKSTYGVTPAEETTMKGSAHIRSYAARIAATHPTIAYDLLTLAKTVEAGEVPPQFKEHMKEKKEEGQGQQDQGQKQASAAVFQNLRSLVIKQAAEHPEAREAFLPILQALKNG